MQARTRPTLAEKRPLGCEVHPTDGRGPTLAPPGHKLQQKVQKNAVHQRLQRRPPTPPEHHVLSPRYNHFNWPQQQQQQEQRHHQITAGTTTNVDL